MIENSAWGKVKQKIASTKQPRLANKESTWIIPRPLGGYVKSKKAMFSCLDFQTNGIDASDSRVLEVAIVRVQKGKLRDSWTTLINPEGGKGVGRSDIHGIKKEWLENAPTFAEIAGDILALIQGTVVVAHNAKKFHIRFLDEELKRAGISGIDGDIEFGIWDTIELANSSGAKSKEFSDLAVASGVKIKKAHHALDNATALAKIIAKYANRIEKNQKLRTTYCGAESSLQVAKPSGKRLLRPRRS